MASFAFRRSCPLRFAWLLALAATLAFAQFAAAAHEVSHARGEMESKQALALSGCDLCLAGAALGAGMPAPDAAPVPVTVLAHGVAPQQPRILVAAAPPAPYRSRAPPLASR